MSAFFPPIAISAIFYVAAAFGAADFNPANWDDHIRGFVAFTWALGMAIYTFICAVDRP